MKDRRQKKRNKTGENIVFLRSGLTNQRDKTQRPKVYSIASSLRNVYPEIVAVCKRKLQGRIFLLNFCVEHIL